MGCGHDVDGWIVAFLQEAASPDDTSYDFKCDLRMSVLNETNIQIPARCVLLHGMGARPGSVGQDCLDVRPLVIWHKHVGGYGPAWYHAIMPPCHQDTKTSWMDGVGCSQMGPKSAGHPSVCLSACLCDARAAARNSKTCNAADADADARRSDPKLGHLEGVPGENRLGYRFWSTERPVLSHVYCTEVPTW